MSPPTPAPSTPMPTPSAVSSVADGTPRGHEVMAVNGRMDSSPATLNVSGLMVSSESEKADLESGGMAEAVNLELVNMNPYGGALVGGVEDVDSKSNNGGLNGIPVKRGDEEMGGDGGFGDPYDEYFVPVNEHRKYIRGEKLYVTKDRRRSQSWRRCACWAVGFSLLAVAILIAILAGTGVILSQEEPRSAVEGRALGAGILGSIPRVAEPIEPNVTDNPGKTSFMTESQPQSSSSFTPPPSITRVPSYPPTTEMSALYVPRVLEGEMTIDSLDYTSDLANHSSSNFQRLAKDLEAELKTALFDYYTMRNGPADIFIKVIDFKPGSVIARFHVGWRFKDSYPSPQDPIDVESLKDRLEAHLLKNGLYLYTYHVSSGSVKANNLMDICQMDNGGCSHECRYDYQEALFACNCPPGLYLEQNGKNCSRDLVDNTVPSTEGPVFDPGPWMPMVPKEPESVTEEVVKLLKENPIDADHVEPTVHPADGSESSEGHDAHSHSDETTVQPAAAQGGKEEETSGGGVVAEEETPNHQTEEPHHVWEHQTAQPSSVGTGRSGGEESIWVAPSAGEEEDSGQDAMVSMEEEEHNGDTLSEHSPSEVFVGAEHDSGEGMHASEEGATTYRSPEMQTEGISEGSMMHVPEEPHVLLSGEVSSTESLSNEHDFYDEYDAHVIPGHVSVDSDTTFNATSEGSNEHGPLYDHVVPAFEHVVVRNESDGEMAVTTEGMINAELRSGDEKSVEDTGMEVALDVQNEDEESKEEVSEEKEGEGMGVTVVTSVGDEGSAPEVLDKVSDGAESDDGSVTTVQDVNYVINHDDESWKDKKGTVVRGGEVENMGREEEGQQIVANTTEEGIVVSAVSEDMIHSQIEPQELDTSKHMTDGEEEMSTVAEGLDEETSKVVLESDDTKEAGMSDQHQVENPMGDSNGGDSQESPMVPTLVVSGDKNEEEKLPEEAEGSVFSSTEGMTKEGDSMAESKPKEEEDELGERLGEVVPSEDPIKSQEGAVTENGVKDEDWKGRVVSNQESAGKLDTVVANSRDLDTSEDEDPNIVPVEEIPKETVDLADIKKKAVVPEIDVRLGGDAVNESNKTYAVEESPANEEVGMKKSMTTSDLDNPIIVVKTLPIHEIVMLNDTHSSQFENSIENLSDKYNSSHNNNEYHPSAENDISVISSHYIVPVDAGEKNESSSGNDKNNAVTIDSQVPFSATVSSSTEASTKATVESDSMMSAMNDSTSPLDMEKEQTSGTSSTTASSGENMEMMKDRVSNSEAEIPVYSMSSVTPSLEPATTTEGVEIMEKKQMPVDDVGFAITTTEMALEEKVQDGLKNVETVPVKEGEVDGTEKPSFITTNLEDHVIEDANTVFAANPTSPSSVFEETAKEKGSTSDSTLAPEGQGYTGGTTESSKGSVGLIHGIPLESDDNEQANNLASVDTEDASKILEEKDPLTVNGVVDVGVRGTTENANELASVGHENWPPTLIGAENVTRGDTSPDEGAEDLEKNLDSQVVPDHFEIPVKKKGELKKPTHHEDEITKPLLFAKEGKESLNKVDKVGLLPITPVMLTERPTTVEGDETSTVEVPSSSEPSQSEASISPVVPSVEKGGERLNVIAEDDSGNRKDIGKAIVKESSGRDLGGESKDDEVSAENSDSSKEEITGREMEGEVSAKNPSAGEVELNEEVVTSADASGVTEKGDVEARLANVVAEESGDKQEVTTASPSIGEIVKGDAKEVIDEMEKENGSASMTTPMDSTEGTTISVQSMESATELLSDGIEPHKNVEEMLKEMGGFGEGGHRVVAKTGVEPLQSSTEAGAEPTEVTMREVADHSSTASISATSSTTSLPPSPVNEVTMTLPGDSVETTTMSVDSETVTTLSDEIDGRVNLKENNTSQIPEPMMNQSMHEKGPVPTLMVHEVVTTQPDPSNLQEVSANADNSTAISSNGDAPEMSTMTPEENPTTALPEPETMVKEETSSVSGKVTNDTLPGSDVDGAVPESVSDGEKKSNDIEGLDGESPGSSNFPELDDQHFPKCTSGQFQCTNGTSLTPYSVIPISSSSLASISSGAACVPLSAKCDSINDCSDGSDEVGCIEDGCPGNFQCSNGQCLKRHLVCNGIVDCNDGSDEGSCDTWQCQFDEYQCPSGRCIPSLWQCDGKPDCENNTDEHNCRDSCGNDEYLCPERWCIPMSWRCNGIAECASGEDEKLCDCSLEQVKCSTGGCVARSEICDGVDQCPDGSDEWDCSRLHNETMELEVRTGENEWLSVCADEWDSKWSDFICQNFGFSRAVFTEYPSSGGLSNSSSVFMLKPGISSESLALQNGVGLPGMLQKVTSSSCASGSIVAISCQEFTCGNHGVAEGFAARLVGGGEAANGQWPSVALLYHTRQRAACTASIISPRWLIASYNCLHMREKSLSPDGWVAFGGGSTFDKDKPETQIKTVKSIVPYPQVKYNRFLYNHDVALVELVEPLIFTQSVGAICLPEKPIEPRQLCVTAGWGYTSPGEMNFSQYLHYLPVPTIELSECNSTKHYSGFITEDKICAGFTDAMHSPCYNDEGAPLMCVSNVGIWELQGVLSYHSNCGRGYHPSIFSSVTSVRDWIGRVVGGAPFGRHSAFSVRRKRSSLSNQ
ncbi:uncharacterized protein LOC124160273 [Ischnura elegans]|uniref:uncharacterized protein LOC124160273 n=1 Tax=Ischnura elegans TaxID=197161 RepID=UPI001ED88661|nr:uncharacterized protein LOC124160273 [Ischnura elegans]